jgi:Polysaccharide pyruvyl transferase
MGIFRELVQRNLHPTTFNDQSRKKGKKVVQSRVLQFYSANRNIGNYLPVLGIQEMLDSKLDVWNIHRSPVDWDFVHSNYSEVIVGGAGLLHSVFEKFWTDLEANCKLPIIIWGIGVCLPIKEEGKGVSKKIVKSIFARSKLSNVRDELTRDFYELDSSTSISICPTLVHVSHNYDVSRKDSRIKQVLHSSHIDLEPEGSGQDIRKSIEESGYKYQMTQNVESESLSLNSILRKYQKSDAVLTTRLHGAIIAYSFKRPYLALSFDPKIEAFVDLYGAGQCINSLTQISERFTKLDTQTDENYKIELDKALAFGQLVKASLV